MKGHTKDNCYKLIGYPADFKGKKKVTAASVMSTTPPQHNAITQDQYNQILKLLNKPVLSDSAANSQAYNANSTGIFASIVSHSILPTKHEHWIVDSGATDHMVGNELLLNTSLTVPNSGKVQLPNDDSVIVTQSGNCQLEGGDDLFTGKVKGIGNEHNGLYTMRSPIANEGSSFKALAVADCREEWTICHQRLGHVPMAVIRKLIFGKKVKMFRSDNGGEFFNTQCKELFNSRGIIHQKFCSYTPQQNGVVERRHMHILETARAIRFQGHLPIRFWGECILVAVFIVNRVPSTVLGNKYPYCMIYKKQVDLCYMRTIGCLCYATNLIKGDKFGTRAIKSAMLGYSSTQKGYKLYDLGAKSINGTHLSFSN
ncbi:uncharacterized protein LOC125858813 [Solanum stenotomum]|uniref:uncharacterized protein LOC125858813 n=1 Tax=Solanum stenotomum TaxID=172797 RepID=UPI0020D04E44|nr:uncharacterized protein LOC125858813 [Solanum stenotomum]